MRLRQSGGVIWLPGKVLYDFFSVDGRALVVICFLYASTYKNCNDWLSSISMVNTIGSLLLWWLRNIFTLFIPCFQITNLSSTHLSQMVGFNILGIFVLNPREKNFETGKRPIYRFIYKDTWTLLKLELLIWFYYTQY